MLNFIPSISSRNQIWQKKNRTIFFAGLPTTAIAFIAFFQINSAIHNIGKTIIEPGESITYKIHLINDASGEISQQGHAVFKGNIYNKGIFDCGECNSGITQFMSASKKHQVIRGSRPVKLHKVELYSQSGLKLDGELQIAKSFRFQEGDIITDTRNYDYFLHFLENSVAINASDQSHVKGYVFKTGTEEFTFPIGDGDRLRKMSIGKTLNVSSFKATYKTFVQEQIYTNSHKFITPYSLDKEVGMIISEGFWKIIGNNSTKLSFYWDPSFDLASKIGSTSDLKLVGWNGKSWELVRHESIKGNLMSGFITTPKINPNEYKAYAFASKRNDFN